MWGRMLQLSRTLPVASGLASWRLCCPAGKPLARFTSEADARNLASFIFFAAERHRLRSCTWRRAEYRVKWIMARLGITGFRRYPDAVTEAVADMSRPFVVHRDCTDVNVPARGIEAASRKTRSQADSADRYGVQFQS